MFLHNYHNHTHTRSHPKFARSSYIKTIIIQDKRRHHKMKVRVQQSTANLQIIKPRPVHININCKALRPSTSSTSLSKSAAKREIAAFTRNVSFQPCFCILSSETFLFGVGQPWPKGIRHVNELPLIKAVFFYDAFHCFTRHRCSDNSSFAVYSQTVGV